ncbi:hypothetical protein HDU98_006392 [Podochytrium sp. JEL0797]|nr:hypothetical protein HDU98_006392 [Podochytrium sp. JEL0797]
MAAFPAIMLLSNVPQCVLVARTFLVNEPSKALTLALVSLENGLIGISACLILVLDVFLLTSFIKFIHATIQDTEIEMDPRLTIISRYGMYTSALWMVGVADGVISSLKIPGSFLMGIIVLMIADVAFFLLLGLKIALYFEEQRSLSAANSVNPSAHQSRKESTVVNMSRKASMMPYMNSSRKTSSVV